MELVERFQSFRRNIDFAENPNSPWYRQKKILMFVCIGIVILIGATVLVFGGYLGSLGAALKQESDSSVPEPDSSVPEPESRVVLPPVEWEGVCPKGAGSCPSSFQGISPLILISLDGFRPDFMERGFTPTIKNLASCGTHAPFMFPVFPTKTFPNHFSQVTGLFPPYHGIVDNNMYDPVKRKLFKVGTPESLDPSWWLKEPIWVTAQKQGKISGCFYWPGSEVEINGSYPTYYKKYNSKVSFGARVDQVLSWLDLPPKSRPHFLTLYVNEPDHALHYHGTKSKQANDALAKVDRMIERLLSGLQQRKLINCVNIVIMSDHGMSDTDCKRVIDIQNYINVNDTFNIAGPFGRVRPKGRRNATIVNEMVKKLSCKNPHMRTFTKEQLPVRMHYADNPRIEPIFLEIDSGWTVVSKTAKADDGICSGGAHGFDNLFPDMRAIFLAHGPAFKRNFTMQPFLNIEVYEMLTELIGVTPNPNNGTRGSLHYIMTSPKALPSQPEPQAPTMGDVPSDDSVYNERSALSTCSCPETPKQLQIPNTAAAQTLHLPSGIPSSSEDISSLLLLYNEDYISAFSLKYQIPLWSSFTIKELQEYNAAEDICWKADTRIPAENSPKCEEYSKIIEKSQHIIHRPLYPQGFSDSPTKEQATFITNSIAKSFNHTNIIEKPFNQMLSRWVSQTGELNVVIGPAFDIFGNGVKPGTKEMEKLLDRGESILIPTHIFVITTWCSIKSESLQNCNPANLQTQAYLLPNHPYPNICEIPEAVINKNVARVADVERLTGISFYTGLPIYEAIRLRTTMPQRQF